jgi:hypothetical protein
VILKKELISENIKYRTYKRIKTKKGYEKFKFKKLSTIFPRKIGSIIDKIDDKM